VRDLVPREKHRFDKGILRQPRDRPGKGDQCFINGGNTVKLIAVMLLALVTGCSTLGGTGGTGGTGRSSGMAALECGAVGAGLATAICIAAGGSAAACAGAAAGGGALGAGICYTYAQKYEKRRQELAGKENDLNARLKYVRGLNEDSEKLNQDLNARVEQVSKRADKIVTQMREGTISQQQLIKEREELLKEENVAKDQVALEKSALEDMKQFQARQAQTGNESAELDAEIRKQECLLAETQNATRALAAQRQRI
jgi:hypothetical protein